MPTIEENKKKWDSFDWNTAKNWSLWWGNSKYQWFGSILPRIHEFLPADRVLEIAPGNGRWTEYLIKNSKELSLVDLSEVCINHCKERFKNNSTISNYYITDGKDLSMVDDDSVDFAFSMDSLVHADKDVIRAYIYQLAKKLSQDGVAFIHHSNLAEYFHLSNYNTRWRSTDVSAKIFEQFSAEAGLVCIYQELINWGVDNILNDCFSIITKKGSKFEKPKVRKNNMNFMEEAQYIKYLHDINHKLLVQEVMSDSHL